MPHETPPALDVRHLRLLSALGKTGAVTRAGALLHLSQSAVSRQLTDLEERLGVTLFERRRRGLLATAGGARLTEAIVGFVEAGFGLGIVTRWAVEPAVRARRLVALPLAPQGMKRRWFAVSRLESSRHELVQSALQGLGKALSL